ncbi:MAG: PEP/pyruvate-binding domain-containing protein, partial [bacterium]
MTSNEDISMAGIDADYRPTFRDFYYLMKWKVTKILLVSSLYDAFTLEEEGLLTEQISGEYQELALSSPPQVVRVPSGEQALRELSNSRYDLVITMSQVVDLDPCEFCGQARRIQHDVPVMLLATAPDEVSMFLAGEERGRFDRAFYWTGDATLLLAIIKCVEDMRNITADTQHGVVKAILVIEDSPVDYSSFLPTLYTEIMKQTQALIAEGLNEQEKWFRKKARPKILLAETFEEAEEIYRTYGEHLLGIITDVAYPRGGRLEEEAGFRFIKEVARDDIPVLVQSSNPEHGKRAGELGIPFRHKHPDTLPQGIRDFLKKHLGFGDFVFRLPDGSQVKRVSDIREFLDVIQKVPLESIRHHGMRNDFSRWLMARGEITLARELKPKRVSDFKDNAEVREYLVGAIRKSRQEKRAGAITEFSEEDFEFEGTFTRLGGGSMGGKGRGLAFLSLLLHHSDVRNKFTDCRVRLPDTLVIGTDVFDRFMTQHNLYERMGEDLSNGEVARHFLSAEFPEDIGDSLQVFLSHVREPLAVRSSSLLEDS